MVDHQPAAREHRLAAGGLDGGDRVTALGELDDHRHTLGEDHRRHRHCHRRQLGTILDVDERDPGRD